MPPDHPKIFALRGSVLCTLHTYLEGNTFQVFPSKYSHRYESPGQTSPKLLPLALG